MGKKLLTSDYNDFVKETFKLPEQDFYNYYLNIVDGHHRDNPEIVRELTESVNRWITWYRQQRGNHIMREVDDDGNRISIDQDNTSIPLPVFGITRHINKSFFDTQLEVLERLDSLIKFRETQRGLERIAPNIVVEATDQLCPYADELDPDKIKQRNAMLNLVWEKYKEKEQTQPTEKVPAETTGQNTINYCIPTSQIDTIHRLCNQHDLMESMDIADFIRLFDLNNTPAKLPVFKRGKKVWFAYVLSHINVTATQAENNFGIKEYRRQKSNSSTSTGIKQVFKNEVGRIFGPQVNIS